MAKPPNQAHNGVEEAIDAGAHQLVTSMEQRHRTPERGHSMSERGQNVPGRVHSTLERWHSTSERGQNVPGRVRGTPDHNISPSGPRTFPSKSFGFPKTKTEARRAAIALLDTGPAGYDVGAMPGVQPRSSLQKPGRSRRSLIEKSRDVHSALKRTLDQLSDHRRRFLYMDLASLAAFERSDLACFMLAKRHGGLAVDGRDTTLTITTYFVDPRFLKQEPIMVRHAAALGWQVSRRRVETPGHAVELLTRRIQALGWA